MPHNEPPLQVRCEWGQGVKFMYLPYWFVNVHTPYARLLRSHCLHMYKAFCACAEA